MILCNTRTRSLSRLFFFAFAFILQFLPPSHANSERVVRVGINEYKPLVFHDKKKNAPEGILVEIIEDVAKANGWRIEYIEGTFLENLERLRKGDIDLGMGLSLTNERMLEYDFCKEPVASTWAQIYTNKKTSIHTILDLGGKTIAYLQGDVMANQFWNLAEQFGIRSTYLKVDTVDHLFSAVKEGKADACICERIGGQMYKNQYSLVKSPIIYFPSNLYFATTKGRNGDILSALDTYFLSEKTNPSSRYNRIIRQWLEEEEQLRIPSYMVWMIRISVAFLVIIGTGAFLVGLHNRRLRHIVLERTSELSAANHRQRAILDHALSFIGLLSPDGRVIEVNRTAMNFVGVGPDEVIGKPFWETRWWSHSPEMQEKLRNAISSAREGGTVAFEATHVAADGSLRTISFSIAPIHDDSGAVVLLIPEGYDITERRRAEAALLSEKERLAVTLRSIGDGVITTDRDCRIALMNKVAEKLTGWKQDEAEGRPIDEIFHIVDGATRERLPNPAIRVLEAGGVIELPNDTILIARDGGELAIADSGAPIRDAASAVIGMVIVFRDVTEKRKMEIEFRKMEKLESVGLLAGGIAHDFNNILTGILGALSVARVCLDPASEAAEVLETAEQQTLRARELTGQLLIFSRGGEPVRTTASVEHIVRDTVTFLLHGSKVKSVFRFSPGLKHAQIDVNQVGRVIHNIVLNAIQAMPDGGIIEITGENVTIGEHDPLPLSPGEYVRLDIHDTGTGIPKEHLARIFDPYFTTKQTGSGLGLAAAYSIIKRHGGYISATSELGKGTAFHIHLPASEGTAEVVTETPGIVRGHGKILVMDDEEGVRKMISKIADKLGYSTEAVVDGRQAIERYRDAKENGEPFDAVIMDLTIPGGMGGSEALALLREYDRDARVIVSSGYSIDPIMSDHTRHGFNGVLMKPYRIEDVAKVLREVIGE